VETILLKQVEGGWSNSYRDSDSKKFIILNDSNENEW
jgi:hypothetical protein